MVALERAGPREREALARRLAAAGGPAGPICEAYPRLSRAGRVRALRLLYDHDRQALRAHWDRFLQDPFPEVVAAGMDLLVESGDSRAFALLARHRPARPSWLVAHWEKRRASLQLGRNP